MKRKTQEERISSQFGNTSPTYQQTKRMSFRTGCGDDDDDCYDVDLIYRYCRHSIPMIITAAVVQ
jgi:hypothetical protein